MAAVIVKAVWQAFVNIKESLMEDEKNQTETSSHTEILSEETKKKENIEKYESPDFCLIFLSVLVIFMVIFIIVNICRQLLNSDHRNEVKGDSPGQQTFASTCDLDEPSPVTAADNASAALESAQGGAADSDGKNKLNNQLRHDRNYALDRHPDNTHTKEPEAQQPSTYTSYLPVCVTLKPLTSLLKCETINEESDTQLHSVNSSSPQPLATYQPCLTPTQLNVNLSINLDCGSSSQLNSDQLDQQAANNPHSSGGFAPTSRTNCKTGSEFHQRGRPCTTSIASEGLIQRECTTPWPHRACTSDARNKLDGLGKRLRPATKTFIDPCGSVRGRGLSSRKPPALHPLSTGGTNPRCRSKNTEPIKRISAPLKNPVLNSSGMATSRSKHVDHLCTLLETDPE